MERTALPFPVLPGADAEAISRRFMADPAKYAESRKALGITLERAYLQKTPMGDFVIGYIESERSFGETTAQMLSSDLELDKFFIATVKEAHGIDLTQPPQGPPPETLAVWSDPATTSRGRGWAFTAPTLPDKRDAGRVFAQDAFSREDMTRTRRALGQSLELVTLVATPMGDYVAVYLEGRDPEASNVSFAASDDEFDVWFRAECRKLFPEFVDFSVPIAGVSEIFDSSALLAHI
ncbi:MAG: hypothetical protein QOK05_571 [Chloroflexota bacterium]|jgi:hypothetical protein|nr:hypothetical protein [Chloroflexota bacterium]